MLWSEELCVWRGTALRACLAGQLVRESGKALQNLGGAQNAKQQCPFGRLCFKRAFIRRKHDKSGCLRSGERQAKLVVVWWDYGRTCSPRAFCRFVARGADSPQICRLGTDAPQKINRLRFLCLCMFGVSRAVGRCRLARSGFDWFARKALASAECENLQWRPCGSALCETSDGLPPEIVAEIRR